MKLEPRNIRYVTNLSGLLEQTAEGSGAVSASAILGQHQLAFVSAA
jgi:hypothetical protein